MRLGERSPGHYLNNGDHWKQRFSIRRRRRAMSTPSEELLVTRKFRVVRHTERGHDGQQHVKDIVVHPGAVTILPLFDDGRVCLIYNQRVAAGKTLIELPAGTLEPGEDPATTALRELAEETGYRAKRVEKLCEFFMSPGILTERMHVYVARGLDPGEAALDQVRISRPAWSRGLTR